MSVFFMLNHKRLTQYKLRQFAVFCEIFGCGRQQEVTLPKGGALVLVLLRGLYHLLVLELNLHTQIATLTCSINLKTYRILILIHKPAILN